MVCPSTEDLVRLLTPGGNMDGLEVYDDDEFNTAMADPAWQYDDQPPRGGAGQHYQLMELDDIIGMGEEIDRITADESHLYLWTTNSFMDEAFDVAEAWGFEQKTIITWCKPSIGVGHYFRNTTEHILFCAKGGLKTETSDIPTHFEAPKTEHSRKPPKAYEIAEKSSPGPMIELFARETYHNWEGVGDEQVDLGSAAEADW